MRLKLVAIAVFLLAGLAAGAQETYCSSANTAQVADMRLHVLGENIKQCQRLAPLTGPAFACTQAQACTGANAPGGASCTAAQARGAGARIYPDTEAGRAEYQTFEWDVPHFIAARNNLPVQAQAAYCRWWATANQASREADCTKANLPITGTLQACSLCL